jgi:hypothetical protein
LGFVNVMRAKRSLMWSHLACSKPEAVRHFTSNRMHNLSLMRSHGGVRQSKLWRCSSCYGSVPSFIGNCTNRGSFIHVIVEVTDHRWRKPPVRIAAITFCDKRRAEGRIK